MYSNLLRAGVVTLKFFYFFLLSDDTSLPTHLLAIRNWEFFLSKVRSGPMEVMRLDSYQLRTLSI